MRIGSVTVSIVVVHCTMVLVSVNCNREVIVLVEADHWVCLMVCERTVPIVVVRKQVLVVVCHCEMVTVDTLAGQQPGQHWALDTVHQASSANINQPMPMVAMASYCTT